MRSRRIGRLRAMVPVLRPAGRPGDMARRFVAPAGEQLRCGPRSLVGRPALPRESGLDGPDAVPPPRCRGAYLDRRRLEPGVNSTSTCRRPRSVIVELARPGSRDWQPGGSRIDAAIAAPSRGGRPSRRSRFARAVRANWQGVRPAPVNPAASRPRYQDPAEAHQDHSRARSGRSVRTTHGRYTVVNGGRPASWLVHRSRAQGDPRPTARGTPGKRVSWPPSC
jgi:hypothetical protein